jgi:hypothetical protein
MASLASWLKGFLCFSAWRIASSHRLQIGRSGLSFGMQGSY